ncbi:MAG: preprotein translocase subunit YajC [Neisseriales bacterium]|jgi:preprotein translocase subunit YajC|nr:MAG: preprotein translocase subunit YajC [Neisseriales bacterium]HRG61929.1 preprotein translocase subunit YajC [Burkholderiales bacterium]
MSLIPSAFADGAAAAASSGPMSSVMSFLPMVVIFALFWLLLIRPQQKKMKLHNQMLSALEKGSEVVTNGGMLGTITDLDEKFIKLRIADGVVVKFQRSAIAGKIDSNAVSAANK